MSKKTYGCVVRIDFFVKISICDDALNQFNDDATKSRYHALTHGIRSIKTFTKHKKCHCS